jgi:ABC-type multidrug transport system ATPase subunit
VTEVLRADCVTRRYGDRRVLSAGTLRAVTGEVRVLFGRNGAGKSTLMKIAAGIVRADSGEVFVDGAAVPRPTMAGQAKRGVFFLPDHDLLSHAFTLGRQLDFFARRFGRGSVEEAARRTSMTQLLHRRPTSFSGGELRRAELALVLAAAPRCLLADEPYRGIAPADHDQLHGLLRSLAADGCSVVVTGHERTALMHVGHHVTWCTAGTTYELGAPTIAARHEAFQREYLGGWR